MWQDEEVDQQSVQTEHPYQLFMAVSNAALSGEVTPRMMQFIGEIQGKQVLILVDSRSSHTFVSSKVAQSLSGMTPLHKPISVQVADGAVLQCSSQLLGAAWSVQGCSFSSDMRVLALDYYDLIVGIDWLEQNSPMKMHWKHKWMVISYLGTQSLLQGLAPALPEGSIVEVSALLEQGHN